MGKRVVDLFAGCGGLSLGFEAAGFRLVGAFEHWDVAAGCYQNNFDHPVFRHDLSQVDVVLPIITALQPDVIIGGPPCQDFSQAGKRIEAHRAGLTESFAQIIAQVKPRWFVMENVDRAQQSASYTYARQLFQATGYGLTEKVLDACRFGVPQQRKRFFCIGALGANDRFLDEYMEAHAADQPMTMRDYFGDSMGISHYYRHPRNYNRRAVFSMDEPSPTIRGVNRPVPGGYKGHPNDATALDTNVRPLTTLERALVQTFPPQYRWQGTKTEMEQMIGNAVPVKLAQFVAGALLNEINRSDSVLPLFSAFLQWLQQAAQFTTRSCSDIVSRLKRAHAMVQLPEHPDEYYLFTLEQSNAFKQLAQTVRSQIKRAVKLYATYANQLYWQALKA